MNLPSGLIIKAINTWIIPSNLTALELKWSTTSFQELDRLIRTSMTGYGMHHLTACMARLYLPRKEGGIGSTNIEESYRSQEKNLTGYFNKSAVPYHRGHTALQLASQKAAPIFITDNTRLEEWKPKALHSRFFHQLQQTEIDKSLSVSWLVGGSLFSETEGFLTAIQDQVIATRSYWRHALKQQNVLEKCRRSASTYESI